MRRWRESLPTRIALLTSGLLAVLLILTGSISYVITANVLRRGVDNVLVAALPLSARGLHELAEAPQRFESRDPGNRRMQILDLTGRVLLPPAVLPVDQSALDAALRHGQAFASLVEKGGALEPRTGPDWWQALTPQPGESRVVYALLQTQEGPMVLQLAAPLGSAGEVLPVLLRWLLLVVLVGSVLAGAIAWRMAAESYRPLRAIIDTAGTITKDTLARRIDDVWRDHTLHRLIEVLNAMIARLQAAFDAQGRFVAAAAHELRTPLAAMRTELEVALRRERSAAEYREALEGAMEETGRLQSLAEHLLILARYERGGAPVMERDVLLKPLLERAAAEGRRSGGADVFLDVPDALALDADSVALERVVSNLVRNGIQAGGAPVWVRAAEVGGEVSIQVEDHGRGIPEHALPRIFEPFFRGDPARRRDGGVGLGLAIVKVVVEAHRGRVEVDSAPGRGTVFRLLLPRGQA